MSHHKLPEDHPLRVAGRERYKALKDPKYRARDPFWVKTGEPVENKTRSGEIMKSGIPLAR